jgi:regulator of PEP synthase PpsR (kinase-PPPase family)
MMDHPPRPRTRILADAIIREMLKEDKAHVVDTVDRVVRQFEREMNYTPEEIEAAAHEVCRDLGIPWKPPH